MAVRIVDDPIKDIRFEQVTCVANDANGAGTGRRSINLRHGFREITALASAEARLGLCPKIVAMYWYDASADKWEDLLIKNGAIIDPGQAGTQQFILDTDDYLYIATVDRVGGFRITIDSSINNDVASTMAFQYSTETNFVTTTILDGTDDSSGTDTLEGTGNITITTMPASGVWAPQVLSKVVQMTAAQKSSLKNVNDSFHWCRMQPSVLLIAVEIEQISTFHPDGAAANTANATAGGKVLQASTEYTIDINDDFVGALEYRSNLTTGTPTVDIDWIKR